MTALARSPISVFDGLGSPSAGVSAGWLKGQITREFWRLKLNTAASSAVFNDLHELAHEHGMTVEHSTVLALAKSFLLAFPRELPQPDLDLDSDGEVLFDWRGHHGQMMTISLREDGRASFAARRGNMDSDNGERQFKDAIPKKILQLVQEITQS